MAVITTRMTAVDCADMLCDYGLPFFDEINFDDTWTFQHDNARPHSAQSTVKVVEILDIRAVNWPPYNNIDQLKSSVLTAWDEISPNTIDNLINSMPARVFD